MPRPRHQLLEVELVEDDELDLDPAAERGRGARRPRELLSRVPGRVWAAVAVAALVAGGGVGVSRHLEESAERARLAGVAGLSVPLDRPLTEAWRARGSGVMAATDELLLLWEPAADGLIAVDRATGDVRYSLPGTCQLAPASDEAAPQLLLTPLVRSEDRLLCLERRFAGLVDAGVDDGSAYLHAVGTGDLLRTIRLGTPEEWWVLGDAVVTLGRDGDQHVVASRWSLESGEQEWAYRSPDPAPTPGDGWMSATDETAVGYRMGGWSVLLDPDTGTPLPAEAVPDPGTLGSWGPFDAGDGATISGTFSAEGRAETTVDPAGADPFTFPGDLVPLDTDDGTADGMLLFAAWGDDPTGSVLHGVDATTGETRWTAQVGGGQAVALAGLIVVRDWLMTTALDASTGEARWVVSSDSTPDGVGPGWGLVTDGRRLLSLEVEDAGWLLVAREVTTGETVWTAPAPVDGGALVQGPDGTVLIAGGSEIVAVGR